MQDGILVRQNDSAFQIKDESFPDAPGILDRESTQADAGGQYLIIQHST